jgi:PilZ domain
MPNTERRRTTRYPVFLPATSLVQRTLDTFSCQVADMSSSGSLVVSAIKPPIGCTVELSIEWPFALDGIVPLRFVAKARVVRHTGNGFAVEFRQHEFRTARQNGQKTVAELKSKSA